MFNGENTLALAARRQKDTDEDPFTLLQW